MEKLRFEIIAKAKKTDEKTSVLYLTSITTTEGEIFEMPEDYQDVSLHSDLVKTEAFKKAQNSIKRRHQKRNIWVVLDSNMKKTYTDDGGNIQFADCILEERILEPQLAEITNTTGGISKEDLQKIINNCEKLKLNQQKNVNKLAEKFVLEKFNSKTNTVTQWMDTFDSECERLNLEKNQEKIEVFRLFLEGSCLDWYSSMLTKLTMNSEWTTWRDTFCDTYEDKGWSPTKYALNFKYLNGPLLDYALKKQKLLLEMDKSIDNKILINLIAVGLPDSITNKINKSEIKETKDLFNSLKSLEYLVKTKDASAKKNLAVSKEKLNKKPCKICEELGKKHRYHHEDMCYFNEKNKKGNQENQIKFVNNSQLECALQNEDQKNC